MKSTLVSVDEYLHSSYEVDCDYVDGELVERNVGEKSHGKLQAAILVYYYARQEESGIYPFIEQRVRISARRYRVPDICLTIGEPPEEVFTSPPFVVIEILSPEDRLSRMQAKIDDYLSFGVRYIWLINPATQRVDIYTPSGSEHFTGMVLRTTAPDSELPIGTIFERVKPR